MNEDQGGSGHCSTSPSSFDSQTSRPTAVAVYCASSLGKEKVYEKAAISLGAALAGANRRLVYGGGSRGLMGVVSKATLDHGGEVTGVIPYAMYVAGGEKEKTASEVKSGKDVLEPSAAVSDRMETVVISTMHERKLEMARRSGGFVALPGGYGTYEEAFEVITWTQLGIHTKPIVFLNILGYYEPIRTLIARAIADGFIQPSTEQFVRFINGPELRSEHEDFDWGRATLKALESWTPQEGLVYRYDWKENPSPPSDPSNVPADDKLDYA